MFDYAHDGSQPFWAITGGYVYRGPVSDLQGLYFFSDYGGSKIWSIPGTGATVTASQRIDWSTAFTPNVGSISSVVSFGEDNAGNLFLVDYNGGEVFMVVPEPATWLLLLVAAIIVAARRIGKS